MMAVGMWANLKQWYVFHVLMGITWFISSLIINFAQLLLYISVRQLSKTFYRRLNYYLTYGIWSQLIFLAEWWSESYCRLHGDPDSLKHMGHEHAIVVMNHTYELDWLMGWIMCDRHAVLASSKVYVKKMLQYVPIIGWTWKFSESVFLERNWHKDKHTITQQLNEIPDCPHPVWLLLFAEGTRYTKQKHEASMEFAQKKGFPTLKHHLFPRTKGFVHTMSVFRGKVPAIYDTIVSFDLKEGNTPVFKNVLFGHKIVGDMHIERIPLDTVPEDEEECANWLIHRYQIKDEMLERYKTTGRFTEEPCEVQIHPRRHYALFNFIFWATVLLTPILYYLYRLLTSGSTLYVITGIICIGAAFLAMYKMIGLTKISKASSYGQAEKVNGTLKKET